MNTRIAFLLIAVVVAGCDLQSSQGNAAAGAPPTVVTAVGPVPGQGDVARRVLNPYGKDDAVSVTEGRRLFVRMNCSGCHGGRGGGGMGPSLRDVTWLYGNRDDQIFDTIAQGRAHGMPAWGTRLPAGEIWKLVSYIQSMDTPLEPDKPSSFP